MSCGQAMDVARAALTRMGYTIAETEPAKPGTPGKVVGRRNSGWAAATPESGREYTVVVRINCSDQGADFEAVTDESLGATLTFRQKFTEEIEAMGQRRVEAPRLSEAPKQGLSIAIEPQRSRDAQKEFGADLPAVGITPVLVKIENRTERTYGFERDKVQMVTQEGERVRPLPLSRVAKTLETSVQRSLREKLIAEKDVAPGGTLKGFLYFPVSAYRRATVIVTDRAADEAEGFSVEF